LAFNAARPLKVYRTPIGFHDVYIAAPSQKAALEAWGADANLFARDIAEIVTDSSLTKEPLANPGFVIRKAPAAKVSKAEPTDRAAKPRQPRPSRDAIEQAEQALSEAEARHGDEKRTLAEREKQLADDRRKLELAQQKEFDRLQRSFDRAKAEYQEALRDWET
jgi:hypothetical protein